MITPEEFTQDIFLMGTLFIEGLGNCKLELYCPDAFPVVPHFHISNENKTFFTCVCIYSNNYFSHDNIYINKFTKTQCKILDEWLSQPESIFGKATNWEIMYSMWEPAHKYINFPENRKTKIKPDYSNMSDYIYE